jgi:hypothetical protein
MSAVKPVVVVLKPTPEAAKKLAARFWSFLGCPRRFGTEGALELWADELFPILKKYAYPDISESLEWAKQTDDPFWRKILQLPCNLVNSIDTMMGQFWTQKRRKEMEEILTKQTGGKLSIEERLKHGPVPLSEITGRQHRWRPY